MASNASTMAIILAPSGISAPLDGSPCWLLSYHARTPSTISKTIGDAQLRLRMSRLIFSAAGHHGRFVFIEHSRLQQNLIGRADDADVVQQRGDFNGLAIGFGQSQLHRPARTTQCHPQRMSGRRRILALQRGEQAGRNPQPALYESVVDGLAKQRRQRLAGGRHRLQFP